MHMGDPFIKKGMKLMFCLAGADRGGAARRNDFKIEFKVVKAVYSVSSSQPVYPG